MPPAFLFPRHPAKTIPPGAKQKLPEITRFDREIFAGTGQFDRPLARHGMAWGSPETHR